MSPPVISACDIFHCNVALSQQHNFSCCKASPHDIAISQCCEVFPCHITILKWCNVSCCGASPCKCCHLATLQCLPLQHHPVTSPPATSPSYSGAMSPAAMLPHVTLLPCNAVTTPPATSACNIFLCNIANSQQHNVS